MAGLEDPDGSLLQYILGDISKEPSFVYLRVFFADQWEQVSQSWYKLPLRFPQSYQTCFVCVHVCVSVCVPTHVSMCARCVGGVVWGGCGGRLHVLPTCPSFPKFFIWTSKMSPSLAGPCIFLRWKLLWCPYVTNASLVPISFYSGNIIILAKDFVFLVTGMALQRSHYTVWKKCQELAPARGNN